MKGHSMFCTEILELSEQTFDRDALIAENQTKGKEDKVLS